MTVVIETGGAQILPPVGDERATVSAWAAHLAADADLRTKSPEYAALAASLIVTPEILKATAPRAETK